MPWLLPCALPPTLSGPSGPGWARWDGWLALAGSTSAFLPVPLPCYDLPVARGRAGWQAGKACAVPRQAAGPLELLPRGHALALAHASQRNPMQCTALRCHSAVLQLHQDELRVILRLLDPASLARAAASCRHLCELSRSVAPGIRLTLFPHQVGRLACLLVAAPAGLLQWPRSAALACALLAWGRPPLQCRIHPSAADPPACHSQRAQQGTILKLPCVDLHASPAPAGAACRAAVDATARAGVWAAAAPHHPRCPVPGAAPAGRRRCGSAALHAWAALVGRHRHWKAADPAAA